MSEPSLLSRYAQARIADAEGLAPVAAQGYATVLEAYPADSQIGVRAYRQAVIAGDRDIALKTARLLDARDALPAEGQLLLFGDALDRKDFAAADKALAMITTQKAFLFAKPVLEAWLAFARGDKNPLARLDVKNDDKAMASYAAEHRVLLQLALNNPAAAAAAIDAARDLLPGREARLRRYVLAVQGRKPLGGRFDAADAPDFGLCELYLRLAIDFNRERMGGVAIVLSQLAVLADPVHVEARLAAAQLLSMGGRHESALAMLDGVGPAAAAGPMVRLARVRLLLDKDAPEEALRAINEIIASNQAGAVEWGLLGDVQSRLSRHGEAARAYGRAIELVPAGEDSRARLALLWLRKGSALEVGSDWPAARAALRKAIELAPDEAFALNYLGYAQLSRGEDIAGARKLLERAIELKPDEPAITDSLGWAYYLQGDMDRAITLLETAAANAPEIAEINEHLGDAYWGVGRRTDARYAWSAALVVAEGAERDRIERKIDIGLEQGRKTP